MEALDKVFTLVLVVVALVLAIPLGVIALPIAGVVLGARALWRRSHPANQLPQGSAAPFAYLEEDDATQEAVIKVVAPYADDEVLGPYAQGVLGTFQMADRRMQGIFSILREEFDQSSITWDKFSVPVEAANGKIVHNAAQLANRIQAFDSKEFLRMGRLERAGAYGDDRPEVTRLKTMRSSLKEMDNIQAANDKLLTELERLQAELTTMAGAGYASSTDEIIEEIRKLAEDTQYYT